MGGVGVIPKVCVVNNNGMHSKFRMSLKTASVAVIVRELELFFRFFID